MDVDAMNYCLVMGGDSNCTDKGSDDGGDGLNDNNRFFSQKYVI